MEKRWWKKNVVYQNLYLSVSATATETESVDLNGITGKLDYLKELGIDVIWLSRFTNHRMMTTDTISVIIRRSWTNSEPWKTFDSMLATAHEKGIKIMMDLVVNHTSDEHQMVCGKQKDRIIHTEIFISGEKEKTEKSRTTGDPASRFGMEI